MHATGHPLPSVVTNSGPNPFSVLVSILRSLTKRHPKPVGPPQRLDDGLLIEVLGHLRSSGMAGLAKSRDQLHRYRQMCQQVDPDQLDAPTALAFWLNLYNAGALDLAAEAATRSEITVLRVPGGFSGTWATIAGEKLSLDAIEHAKIRRFKDPRIHGALVCGSASCPTLRDEPYRGPDVDGQLDDQLRSFFTTGGVAVVGAGSDRRVMLSRVLHWYGNDFVRPRRMPVFIPAGKKSIARAVRNWLPGDAQKAIDTGATIDFQPYHWSLACSIG